ncbi:hypothetical protein C0993_012212, partial [Termitomyces sp. T159_Od127]
LHSTNPHIDWWNLTLHFDCQALECLELIFFNVTAPAGAHLTAVNLRLQSTDDLSKAGATGALCHNPLPTSGTQPRPQDSKPPKPPPRPPWAQTATRPTPPAITGHHHPSTPPATATCSIPWPSPL